MSIPTIATNIPDPFFVHPSVKLFQNGKATRVSSTAILTSSAAGSGSLTISQCSSPMLVNATVGAYSYTLPTAAAFASLNQLQNGDTLLIPVYSLSTSTQAVTFNAAAGSTGSSVISAYSSAANAANGTTLKLTFTYNGATNPPTWSYVLSQ